MTDRDERIWGRLADLTDRVEALERHAGARQLAAESRQQNLPVDPDAWGKTLQTAGGASAVASALATHLRGLFEPRGPRDMQIADVGDEASVTKLIEVLKACSARLREFAPSGAVEVDLSPLGRRPFTSRTKTSVPACSFCGKAQREVTKLIAGPCVYICNECVDLSNSIISEG